MTYQEGFDAGYADGKIICQPVKTNGHSLSEFIRIRAKYYEAIYNLEPTEYQRGYGDGLDKAADERDPE